MISHQIVLTGGLLALGALALVSGVWMWSFRAWLDARAALTLTERQQEEPSMRANPIAMRIDVADLRERVRRLEQIAAGIDMA